MNCVVIETSFGIAGIAENAGIAGIGVGKTVSSF
jgi:hypothetical protein